MKNSVVQLKPFKTIFCARMVNAMTTRLPERKLISDVKFVCHFFDVLEIKPCGVASRIRDMEVEWRLRVITDKISWWIFGTQNRRRGMNQMLS